MHLIQGRGGEGGTREGRERGEGGERREGG